MFEMEVQDTQEISFNFEHDKLWINSIWNGSYISFSKTIAVDYYLDKKGKSKPIKREIRFIDSFNFMASSLEKLVKNLDKDQLVSTRKQFKKDGDFELVSKKGVYPYEYMSGLDKFGETLPPKDAFYSKLTDTDISEADYSHAQKVWENFNMKTMKEYHDLYLLTDVMLLEDVFESFRTVCRNNYGLDPAWYYTSPGLSWDALLKITEVELELLTDIDKLLMFEKGIRGGVSTITKRHAKANNKYLDDFDQKKCKGVKKNVVTKTITFEDYKTCLFSGKPQMRTQNTFRSRKHEIYTETVNKTALSSDDDKRIILRGRVNTLAIGHYRIDLK